MRQAVPKPVTHGGCPIDKETLNMPNEILHTLHIFGERPENMELLISHI